VWFVGDTGVDMECAGNSGCVPVLLGGEPTSEEMRECTPRLAFADPAALFHFMRGL
jgi:phosphoglycolate phosphatase